MTTPDQDRTLRVDGDAVLAPAPNRDVQFAPGALIAGRYRIATLLGKGGMGEVYRADDIKLGQSVALKFLPARLARDPILLARLHDEVRLGRQVAHPNVCRTYDIGEYENAHFVAMEYVDGEDLAHLLRRIGRLAHDKAVDIARGIAAGLMAAHAKGIVHRDLKPANVMIDSHGDPRITDFGLALSDADTLEAEVAGTPAYMAPEQLQGEPATVQSDLYALGLVMYELFTGRRAHAARTLPERLRDASSSITLPSAHIRDLDPAVEKIILRCLAPEPAQRPRSARAVIEALPGGDPLAAALAAGETPSPKIVAAAGSAGVLSRRTAWSILATIGLLFVLAVVTFRSTTILRYTPAASPEVLRDRAEGMLRGFGIPTDGEAIANFYVDSDYFAWLYKEKSWEPLRRGTPWLRYRLEYGPSVLQSEVIGYDHSAPGWTTIEVDARGRLAFLLAAPRRDWSPSALDWNALLLAAGLEPARLQPATVRSPPAAPFDAIRAWSGTYPGDATPVRIEAAAWKGRPVSFRVSGAWSDIADPTGGVPFASRALGRVLAVVMMAIIAAGIVLAWRNLRGRRGDRSGAARVTGAVFGLELIGALLRMPVDDSLLDFATSLAAVTGRAMLTAALTGLLYIALEPYVRRRWPATLIAWSRLVGGAWRDPMVGRDTLIGIAGGLFHACLVFVTDPVLAMLGGPAAPPHFGDPRRLNGVAYSLGAVLQSYGTAVIQAFMAIVLLVIFAIVLRRRGLAVGALALSLLTTYYFATGGQLLLFASATVLVAVIVLITVRYGLLALAVMQGTFLAIVNTPSMIGSAWATPLMILPAALVVAITIRAFRTSLGDQPVWPESLDA